jgi:hypothetical protein
VDRLKAAGNGQVPGVAALAWRILTGARVGSRVINPDNSSITGATASGASQSSNRPPCSLNFRKP